MLPPAAEFIRIVALPSYSDPMALQSKRCRCIAIAFILALRFIAPQRHFNTGTFVTFDDGVAESECCLMNVPKLGMQVQQLGV